MRRSWKSCARPARPGSVGCPKTRPQSSSDLSCGKLLADTTRSVHGGAVNPVKAPAMLLAMRKESGVRIIIGILPILFVSSLAAQPLTVGVHVPDPTNTSTISQTLAPVSYVNLTDFATAAGTVNKASVYWSRACTAAFKVVFLRTGFTTNSSFTVVATRGPFNSVDGRNDVTLIPPVTLAAGDLIGVVQLQPLNICGSVRTMDYGGNVGYNLITTGDISTAGALGSPSNYTPPYRFSAVAAAGTPGFSEEGLSPSDAINFFRHGALFTPDDPVNFRMNIGVRTLDNGATLNIPLVDAAGNVQATRSVTYPANYFEQDSFATFTGTPTIPTGGQIIVSVAAFPGTAFIYSSVIDNRTNDSTYRLADIK